MALFSSVSKLIALDLQLSVERLLPMTSHLSLHRNSPLLFPALLALVLVASVAGPRSTEAGDEVVWRPVDPSDLAMKAPIVEADADAEAIFWDIRIDDHGDNDLVLQHYVRIKIFTERGREKESRIDIAYLTGTKIKDVAARTIKPNGTIIELAKEDVIEKIIVKVSGLKLQTKSFAFPGIEIGSIIEYRWKEVISNVGANNMRLQFQREIPVQSITYHIKPADSSTSFDLRAYHMEAPEFQKEKNGFQFITVTKMPAFHEEPMMPPEDSVRKWAIVRYHNLFSILFGYEFMASRLYNTYQPYLKVDDEIKRKSAEIVAGATTPEQKLEKIFDFCRANIKNTDYKSSGFTAEEVKKLKENKKSADTLKRGVGPGIDVNLLFGALANAAGFDSYVALMPDRERNFFDKNAVIPGTLRPANIAVRVSDTWRFFDPGYHYVTFDMLRWQEEGVDALIAKESPRWVKSPMSLHEKSRETRTATLRLDENGTLEGDVKIEYTGHRAVEKKVQNDDDSPNQREENLKEAVKNRLSAAELTNIVIENVTDPAKPFIYRYHVRVPDYAQRTGKRLFLQPAFFQKGAAALFETSTRRFPIYFHYPWSEEDKVTISLPKGYALDNADSPAPTAAGAISRYEVNIGASKDGSTLVYNRSFFFGGNGSLLFPAESYQQIKKLFDELNTKDNHTITLKQSGSPGSAPGSAGILPAESELGRLARTARR